ncbi:nucleolar protein [Aspergillus melleus]|uniref:Nucleolar protein n=1 Tax=Aspergillus melleus TaxID=138277 RepID=A0ACC3APR6_9EURO|nr:nucleolar protein [Aspergillus melleus]
MAPSKKDNKRKAAAAAAAADSPAKKTKKADAKPAEAPKEASKSILKKSKGDGASAEKKSASNVKFNGEPARQIKPRKRAADFLSDDEDSEPEVDAKPAKAQAEKGASNKKTKKEDGTAAPAAKSKAANAKAAPKSKKPEVVADESDDDDSVASESGEGEEEEDDRTVALIKGFESSGDEDESGDEGYDPSKPVPKIPDSKKAKRKILKKQKDEKSGNGEEPGVVYVGRIPHGFYEHQMRAYFSQFGEILRLRLSRNRITGRSKHYAFVEFESVSVAKIVAATMDNYLMYGHILKCKYVPSDQLHPEVFKGANRRFKKTPWNRIEKKRLDKGKTRDQWSERIGREQKKRLAKAEKLKELGYELELPQLMSVDDVPVQGENKEIEAPKPAEEETPKAVEAPKETKAEKKSDDTPKKSKKEKKGTQSVTEQDTPKQDGKKGANEAAASPATKAGPKAKKGKGKAKAKA